MVANLKIGVRTIWDTPMLRSLFLLGAPAFFAIGLWNVLLLPMAITVLGGTDFQYGIQEGLTSVGFVLGSLFMARYADRLQVGLWIFVGMLGMGISGILYGLSPDDHHRHRVGDGQRLLQLAARRRAPDAAPAQHAARAPRPRLLGACSSCAT